MSGPQYFEVCSYLIFCHPFFFILSPSSDEALRVVDVRRGRSMQEAITEWILLQILRHSHKVLIVNYPSPIVTRPFLVGCRCTGKVTSLTRDLPHTFSKNVKLVTIDTEELIPGWAGHHVSDATAHVMQSCNIIHRNHIKRHYRYTNDLLNVIQRHVVYSTVDAGLVMPDGLQHSSLFETDQ
ncbi:hypothetical protein J6590_000632 [Homalodisca vitripennis]|nr:hypothetical protein J6590_000632 [Homalodisca vitripennis]